MKKTVLLLVTMLCALQVIRSQEPSIEITSGVVKITTSADKKAYYNNKEIAVKDDLKRNYVIVAASNAPGEVKAMADFLCDGVDDQLEIHKALYESARYEVLLTQGDFYISSSIYIPDYKISRCS